MSECSTSPLGTGPVVAGLVQGQGRLDGQLAEHEGLVHWVVGRQWLGELSYADALHEGRIGLWRALRGYDPGRGYAFSTYAVWAIQRSVWKAVARENRRSRADEGPGWSGPRAGLALELAEPVPDRQVPDPLEALCSGEVRAELARLIGQLRGRGREILIAHYGLGRGQAATLGEIGRLLGVSRQRVGQLQQAALVFLAEPGRSLRLRELVGRDRRSDYRRALGRREKLARARRGRR